MSSPAPTPRTADRPGRRLTWPALVGLLALFALLPSFVNVFILHARSDFRFPDQASVTRTVVTASIGLLVVVLAVTWLRWWPDVLREERRTRAWVWVIPLSVLVVSLAFADYPRAAKAGALLSLTLILGTLLIASGEELLFRGIVLVFLRGRHSEVTAAIGSSVLFGLVHFPAGPVQMAFSMAFGYLLYLTRRASGGIALPILVHAAWDLSVFTSATTDHPADGSNASLALALLTLVLLVVVIIGRRRIDRIA